MHFDRRIYVRGAMYRHYILCSSVRAVEKFIAETQRRIRFPPLIGAVGWDTRRELFPLFARHKKILFFQEKVAATPTKDSKLPLASRRVASCRVAFHLDFLQNEKVTKLFRDAATIIRLPVPLRVNYVDGHSAFGTISSLLENTLTTLAWKRSVARF